MVLIVDDEPANLSTFARSFRAELVVCVAGSGLAALDALDREPIEILFTDYNMPTMTGLELLGVVATRWPSVHRVILSGHTDLPELHNAHRLGLAAALIPKPWRKAEILQLVQRLLGGPGGPGAPPSEGR